MDVGYYTSVIGLGRTPTDTSILKVIGQNGSNNGQVGALNNFWRTVENVHMRGMFTWAVSQASPVRRMVVDGDVELHQWGAWSSGGYMADCTVNGQIRSGS